MDSVDISTGVKNLTDKVILMSGYPHHGSALITFGRVGVTACERARELLGSPVDPSHKY